MGGPSPAGGGGYKGASPPVAAGAAAAANLVFEAAHTITSRDQEKTERDVQWCVRNVLSSYGNTIEEVALERERHVNWLERGLMQLPTNFSGLDASRPWFVFWITHALEILDAYKDIWPPQVASFLKQCQDPTGGFGGGPGQLPHLAPTYAATSALIIAGTEEAYAVPDRARTYEYLMRMKSPHGGFMMHDQGETDMRGTYCALAVASMLHILTDELKAGVAEYVRSCQTYEGGIAGERGLEAHGGYSYCGLAALCIIGEAHRLDLHALLDWAVHRQMAAEGGFQGRTNKLVDSCYSFWQGALFPLIHEAFRQQGKDAPPLPEKHVWYKPDPLQVYNFLACQHQSGGMRDKPGKSADFYHTCYALSGVSAAQLLNAAAEPTIVGRPSNQVEPIDAYYNVHAEKAERKCEYFKALPPIVLGDGRKVQGAEGSGAALARANRPRPLPMSE
eukprot:TRINITY_DN17690_c0_g1_i1.p1 TRINITY_DN17690_c0_g1~~TRINITY_DN17690_c0_g1_i1.p1  ORF type:complete len:475 (+),score=70.39 TRINITY_DN17690_c0_g1_i1:83-1426(+)